MTAPAHGRGLADRQRLVSPAVDRRRTSGRQRRGRTVSGRAACAERSRHHRRGHRHHHPDGRGSGRRTRRPDSGAPPDDTEARRQARSPWSTARRLCPESRRSPARARPCGARWPPPPAIAAFIDSDLIDPDPMFVPWLVGACSPPTASTWCGVLPQTAQTRPTDRTPTAEGGSPNSSPARCWRRYGRNRVACSNRWAGSTPGLANSPRCPFAPGYGVEIGILIDTYDRFGLDAIAQVNLGVRTHRNRPLHELGPMSRQIIATLLTRCGVEDSGGPHPVLPRRRRRRYITRNFRRCRWPTARR